MKLALVVGMACMCGINVVGPFMPQPPKPKYIYYSSLSQSLGVDTLQIGKWREGEMSLDRYDDIMFPLPWPCLPIPKELR